MYIYTMWDIILNIKENKKVLEKKNLKKTHAYGYNNFTSHKENRLIRHPGTNIGV